MRWLDPVDRKVRLATPHNCEGERPRHLNCADDFVELCLPPAPDLFCRKRDTELDTVASPLFSSRRALSSSPLHQTIEVWNNPQPVHNAEAFCFALQIFGIPGQRRPS